MPKVDQQTQFEAGGLEVILDLSAVLCESPPKKRDLNRGIREIRGKELEAGRRLWVVHETKPHFLPKLYLPRWATIRSTCTLG